MWVADRNAHVDSGLLLLADRAHGLLLDDAQQFHLHVQGQIRDFIEKQRPALGGLDQSLFVAHRTGEAAALVPEELAFHELGGNGAAIDRDERAVAARAGLVNEFRHQFLAGARLAENMHGRLAARDARNHLAQVLHGGGGAEQAGAEYAGVASLVSESLMAVATNLRSPARSSGLETKSKAPNLSARTAVSMLP